MADTEDTNAACAYNGTFSRDGVIVLNEVNYNSGFIMVLMGFWLGNVIVRREPNLNASFRNLGNYVLAVALRRCMPGVIHVTPFLNIVYSWQDFTFIACDFFGFWETFFAVFELESFTMVCLERYVQAKYVSNGWSIPACHNYLYGSLCAFFAFMYAYSPVAGIGRYAKDFNCYHCTFDMILPEVGWKRLLVLSIFFMRSIKPAMIMLIMIYEARRLESKLRRYRKPRNFTKGVKAALSVNLVLGLPITLVRGTVVLSQLIYDKAVIPSSYFIAPALCLHWVAPLPAMFAMIHYDTHLHNTVARYLNFGDDAVEEDDDDSYSSESSQDEADNNDQNDNGQNDHDKRD